MIKQAVSPHRIKVFRVMLGLSIFGGSGFAIINFKRGLILLATLELVIGLIAMFLYLRVKEDIHHSTYQWLSAGFVVFFASLIVLAMFLPGVSQNIYVWIMIMPLMAYLLMGAKRGFWVTLIFMGLTVLRYAHGVDWATFVDLLGPNRQRLLLHHGHLGHGPCV